MDVRSTKTPAQKQDDEARRLVRPAPKKKPPRHDRRRERDNSDEEVDPDEVADRKDRSENYKTIGGSDFQGKWPLAGVPDRLTPLVAAYHVISSYPAPKLMAPVSGKAAVYHGVAPYGEGTPGQTHWGQPAQRDLGDTDWELILKSAKEWLKTPVLSMPMVGATRDTQLRAALDLAIYQGPYNGAIQPNNYNMLLARLAGADEHQTLLTQRTNQSMKASHEIRKLAAKYAAEDAALAYDLMDLASKVAQDEGDDDQGQQKQAQDQEDQGQEKQAADKYAALRSAVIQAASKAPEARQAFLPVLQAIKTLG